jgi:hypothetical protein
MMTLNALWACGTSEKQSTPKFSPIGKDGAHWYCSQVHSLLHLVRVDEDGDSALGQVGVQQHDLQLRL